jgi:threonine synthase
MDIQVSSNFERLLFDLYDRDGAALAKAMQGFRKDGRLDVGRDRLDRARALFSATRYDDAETTEIIRREYAATGEILDPHSAIGVAAAQAAGRTDDTPIVALGTAHPAKFPDAVEKAVGKRPALPDRMKDLYTREERCMRLPNDLGALRAFIQARVGAPGGKRSAA